MLIIEGPDGVGKTTLCNELLKRLPTHIYSHFARLPNKFDYYWSYVDRMSRLVVQDRFHMSEIVYAKVRGEDSPLDPETYRLVDARLRLLGGLTVLVTASRSLVGSRWTPNQMYTLDQTLEAARLFEVAGDNREEVGVDIDFCFHCEESSPYVTGDAINQILKDYFARQAAITRIAGRRTPLL